jgi:hypothetical protein
MGVDFTALLDHCLEWDGLVRLDRALDSEWRRPSSPLRILPVANPVADRWRWSLSPTFSSAAEELSDRGQVTLDSPTGFHCIVYRTVVEVCHVVRWAAFLTDTRLQTDLRRAVGAIAGVLRSSEILYLPDSSFPCSASTDVLYEDGTLADVKDWLCEHCGPPAGSIAAIYTETGGTWEGDGYFLETPGQIASLSPETG